MLLTQKLFSLFRPDLLDPKFSLKQRVPKHDVALLSLGKTQAKLAQWNARNGVRSVKLLERNDVELVTACRTLSPQGLLCVSIGDPLKLFVRKAPIEGGIAFGENHFVQAEFTPDTIPQLEERFGEFSLLRIFPEPLALLYAIHHRFRPEHVVVATHNTFVLSRFDPMGICQAVSIFQHWDTEEIPPEAIVYRNATFTGDLRTDERLPENLELELLCA